MMWDTPKFKVGEVVALRSSKKSNPMTIEAVTDEEVACVWMDRDGRVRRDKFLRACLKESHEADAHIVFMPELMLNEEGAAAFIRSEYKPRASLDD